MPDLVVSFDDIPEPNVKFKAPMEALEAMQPKDVHELMLCIQILALHRQGMNYMYKLSRAEGMFADRYLNASTKLMRLHGEKLEALVRYRDANAIKSSKLSTSTSLLENEAMLIIVKMSEELS